MAQHRHIGGFWSYVHHDDEHENGRITRLRERLERSVRFFSGSRDFQIFQDRKNIGWGEKWATRLASSVHDALLLFPVITPSYFSSNACKEEALAFRNRQEALQRDDLILPIYYLTAAQLENAEYGTPEEIDLATLLRAHQYEDWRTLRDTPESDLAYANAVERLAQKAVEALARASPPRGRTHTPSPSSPKSAPRGKANASGGGAPASAASEQAVETVGDSGWSTEPGLIIALTVNPMPGRAQFTTVSEAIARAPSGARILIAPGHYRENLVIDKPLELIGDGSREDIIVEADGSNALLFDTNIGVVRNLTFRQSAADVKKYCVWIKQGRLELEDCYLSSNSLAGLAVSNNADPRVRRSCICNGAEGGIMVYENGRGTYEENEIFGNTLAGIEVRSGADPVVRRNRIYDGGGVGISINAQARGTFEDNEIVGNALAGIIVKTGAMPVVRRNRIYDGREGGIFLCEEGRGTFEDNEISGNTYSGIEVKSGADPIVRRNQIHNGKQSGIYVHDEGRGTFEYNQIEGNRTAGIAVAKGGTPTARGNRITGNLSSGIQVSKGGLGVFEDNELSGNGRVWDIDPSAQTQVTRSRNQET